jgi:hypothetical protein
VGINSIPVKASRASKRPKVQPESPQKFGRTVIIITAAFVIASVIIGVLAAHLGKNPKIVVWSENFEAYAAGSWPSLHWIMDANGGSIDNTVAYDGSQSLKLLGQIGGCWAGIGYRALNTTTPFYIEAMIRNGSESLSGCHPDRGDICLKEGTSWMNPGRQLVSFKGDGTILSSSGNMVLSTYSTLQWYKIKVLYERDGSNITLSYWIDDVLKGSETLAAKPEESDMTYLGVECQEGSAWFDDVKVVPI